MSPILLYDTTLRDGTQGENINFSAEEKLKIAKRLDDAGIHYIEGGWPGSNPRDKKFFELAASEDFRNTSLAAFGSTRRPGIATEDDANVSALIESGTSIVTIFGKTWDMHVKQIMDNTLEENLAMIRDTVAYLKAEGREVIYDAEHFFDGYNENQDYAMETLYAAQDAG
ncbi:MAG: citramalate synthase, partial [Desulfobulbia bacterium]